jgi:hypothetical protein
MMLRDAGSHNFMCCKCFDFKCLLQIVHIALIKIHNETMLVLLLWSHHVNSKAVRSHTPFIQRF